MQDLGVVEEAPGTAPCRRDAVPLAVLGPAIAPACALPVSSAGLRFSTIFPTSAIVRRRILGTSRRPADEEG